MTKSFDLYKLDQRKTIHININRATHAEFKVQCFRHELSMQEVLEEFLSRIANEETDALMFLKELRTDKKSRIIKKLKNIDAESIYDMISDESPLSDD